MGSTNGNFICANEAVCARMTTAAQSSEDGSSVSLFTVPPLFSFFTDEFAGADGPPTASDVFPSALVFVAGVLRESSGFSPGWP